MSKAENPRAVAGSNSAGLDRKRLASFVRRAEAIEVQVAELNRDKSDIFKESKGMGFDPARIKAVMRRRRKDPDALAREDAEVSLYEAAINAELGPPDPKEE